MCRQAPLPQSSAANRVMPGSHPGKRLMNTISQIAERRGCTVGRVSQIIKQLGIKPMEQIGNNKLFADTQAAEIVAHRGNAGRPATITAWQILVEIAKLRRKAKPSDMFADGVSAMYRWCVHARSDCPIRPTETIKQMVSPFLATPGEYLPAWRMADHDAILEWAVADLPII